MKKELEILRKKGYFVKVDNVGDKILVTYPAYNLSTEKSPSFTKEYQLVDGGVILDNEFVSLPFYLRRVAILSDIVSQCKYINIKADLIFYFKEGVEVDNINTAVTLDLAPEDLDKEKRIVKMLNGEEVPLEEQIPIFKSFKMMKGIMYS